MHADMRTLKLREGRNNSIGGSRPSVHRAGAA